MVEQLVTGTMRVENDDLQIGFEKRPIVVAAIPQKNIRFLLDSF